MNRPEQQQQDRWTRRQARIEDQRLQPTRDELLEKRCGDPNCRTCGEPEASR